MSELPYAIDGDGDAVFTDEHGDMVVVKGNGLAIETTLISGIDNAAYVCIPECKQDAFSRLIRHIINGGDVVPFDQLPPEAKTEPTDEELLAGLRIEKHPVLGVSAVMFSACDEEMYVYRSTNPDMQFVIDDCEWETTHSLKCVDQLIRALTYLKRHPEGFPEPKPAPKPVEPTMIARLRGIRDQIDAILDEGELAS